MLDFLPDRAIVVAGETIESIERLISVAEPLARRPGRELIVACLVRDGAVLARTMSVLDTQRVGLEERGVSARVTTFTSDVVGADIVRLTALPDVDLALIEGAGALGEEGLGVTARRCSSGRRATSGWSGHAATPLCSAPTRACSYRSVVMNTSSRRPKSLRGSRRSNDAELWLLGRTAGGEEEARDASRLLGNVALAVQRVTKIVAKPLLVQPGADAVLDAVQGAGLLVLGFPDDWERRGLGSVRAVLARDARPPVVAVRAGSRPSGVVPQERLTRFSWTLSGSRA